VDAEQERGLATRFDVSGFPTLRLFPRSAATSVQLCVPLTGPPWSSHTALKFRSKRAAGLTCFFFPTVFPTRVFAPRRGDGPAETYFLDDLDGGLFAAASNNGGSSGGRDANEVSTSAAEEAQTGAAVAALVSYVNLKAGTSRAADGALQPAAGRVPAADRFLRTAAAAGLFGHAPPHTAAAPATSALLGAAFEAALAALRRAAGSSAPADLYVAVLEKVRRRATLAQPLQRPLLVNPGACTKPILCGVPLPRSPPHFALRRPGRGAGRGSPRSRRGCAGSRGRPR
jgi:hypothetical protein